MLTSIIIPVFNHAKYVMDALSSAINQSHSDIEIIVVDDCSTDASYAVIGTYIEKISGTHKVNIQLKRNRKNLGSHLTINNAMKLAKGEFLTILNSDDLYHPERIKRLVNSFRSHGPDRLYMSTVEFINDQGLPFMGYDPAHEQIRNLQEYSRHLPTLTHAMLFGQIGISTGNFAFSRSLWERLHGFSDLKYCHDWEFGLRAAAFAEPMRIEDPLYQYRLHEKNTFRALSSVAIAETRECHNAFAYALNSNQSSRTGSLIQELRPILESFGIIRSIKRVRQS